MDSRYWNDKGIQNGEGDSCADLNTTALAFFVCTDTTSLQVEFSVIFKRNV